MFQRRVRKRIKTSLIISYENERKNTKIASNYIFFILNYFES